MTHLIKMIGNQTLPSEQKLMAFVTEIRSESFFFTIISIKNHFGGETGLSRPENRFRALSTVKLTYIMSMAFDHLRVWDTP